MKGKVAALVIMPQGLARLTAHWLAVVAAAAACRQQACTGRGLSTVVVVSASSISPVMSSSNGCSYNRGMFAH
jgi:hypothetical protein